MRHRVAKLCWEPHTSVCGKRRFEDMRREDLPALWLANHPRTS